MLGRYECRILKVIPILTFLILIFNLDNYSSTWKYRNKKTSQIKRRKMNKRFNDESSFLINSYLMATRSPFPVPRRIERERRNSVHARLSKNRTTPSSVVVPVSVQNVIRSPLKEDGGGRSKKTRDHVSFSLNPQQDARVYQCIRRVGHCGGLSGNFRSWESYTKTLHSLFIQSSLYSRLWKYILSTCPPFRLFESASRPNNETNPNRTNLLLPNLSA